jgi:hypothetical protein
VFILLYPNSFSAASSSVATAWQDALVQGGNSARLMHSFQVALTNLARVLENYIMRIDYKPVATLLGSASSSHALPC